MAFLNQQISPQEHKKQVTEQLKNLTQGRAAQHQKLIFDQS